MMTRLTRRAQKHVLALTALALALAMAAPTTFSTAAVAAGSTSSARAAILKSFGAPGSFSAARGKALFLSHHTTGKPATPSCSTCHTKNPRNSGRTRAGKVIKPMAISRNPQRFTDPAKVAKWFRRNCKSVLGRPCTAQEKGDYITFMSSL